MKKNVLMNTVSIERISEHQQQISTVQRFQEIRNMVEFEGQGTRQLSTKTTGRKVDVSFLYVGVDLSRSMTS